MKTDEGTYSTKDMYEAVILRTAGYKLNNLNRSQHSFITFTFQDPNREASRTIANHWNRELKVISRDLIESINEIKSRIHNRI